MRAATELWWRLRRAGAADNRVPGILAVVSFAVATAALLVCVAGLHAFEARNPLPPGGLEGHLSDQAALGTELPRHACRGPPAQQQIEQRNHRKCPATACTACHSIAR